MSEFENNSVVQKEEKIMLELSWWERVKYLIMEPSKTMEYLGEKPKVLFSLLAILFGFALLILPKMDLMREFTKDQMLQQYAAQGIQVEQMPDNIFEIGFWSGVVGAALAPFLGVWIKSGVVHLLSRITGEKGKFKAVLSVVSYAYLIQLLGEGVRTLITVLTSNIMVYTSPAVFLPDTWIGKPLHTLLASLDVFSLWYLVLATIGLAYAHKMSRKKAGIIIFGSWFVMVLFSVGATLIKIGG